MIRDEACLQSLIGDIRQFVRERWLPRMATGELTGCLALTEPDAGSEATNIRTTARRDGDHYVLDGEKRFIERYYRDVRLFRLYEGRSQIHQLNIAKLVLQKKGQP